MNYLILLFLFLGINFLILKKIVLKKSCINSFLIALIFSIKFIFASSFITYQNAHQSIENRTDYDNYLHDSKLLNHIFYNSPSSYLKILSGIGNESETNEELLSNSNLWFSPHNYIVDYRIVSRIHSVIEFIAQGNEYMHLLFVAFISTLSLILFVSAFQRFLSKPNIVFIALGLLLPSILLFSSPISKDYILLFGLSAVLYAISRQKWISFYFLGGLFLLITVKIYIFFVLLIALSCFFVLQRFRQLKHQLILFSLFIVSGFILLFSSLGTQITNKLSVIQFQQKDHAEIGFYLVEKNTHLRDKIYPFNLQDTIHFTRNNEQYISKTTLYTRKSDIESRYYCSKTKIHAGQEFILDRITYKNANSYVQPYFINFNKSNLIQSIPYGIFFTFTQPNFSFFSKLTLLPFVLETYLLLCLSIFSIIYAFKYNKAQLQSPLCLAICTFIVLSAFIIGISGATIGALIRYRLPTYIALVLLNFILINPLWKKKSH